MGSILRKSMRQRLDCWGRGGLKRFFFCLFFLLGTAACDTVYQTNIPYAPVYLELDLAFQDKDLVPISAYKVFTRKNVHTALERAGFAGVLVYHGLDGAGRDAFYAFEICCPHECRMETVIEMDESNVFAQCHTCGTKYQLMYGLGSPEGGKSKFSLHRYTIFQRGSELIVRN